MCDSLFTPAPHLCWNMDKTPSEGQRGDLLPEVGGNGNSVVESYRTRFQFLPLRCRETRMKRNHGGGGCPCSSSPFLIQALCCCSISPIKRALFFRFETQIHHLQLCAVKSVEFEGWPPGRAKRLGSSRSERLH